MMRKIAYSVFVLLLITTLFVNNSCKKDDFLSDGPLSFSVDTLVFDTVFTTVGSTTRRFKIYNKNNRPVKIKEITLAGGNASNYRINIDGIKGLKINDVTIGANDSLFAFVEVTLDPNDMNTPLIVEDSILFTTDKHEQRVVLAAWGQDAYFYYNGIFLNGESGILPNDKPHVVYGFAAVDSAQSLTVQAGTRFHLHKNALLIVYKGALAIEGTVDNKVIIEGDRLEPFYQDVKGQYYGVYFSEALPSSINHAIIKNGTAGIHVFSSGAGNNYTLEVRNTEIYNHASYGIFNYSGGAIYGENLLVHNNGLYAFFQLEGGAYNYRQSHFLSYGSDGNQPAVAIRNYFTRSDGITYLGDILEGNFFNSVIYGNSANQIAYDTLTQDGAVAINYNYVHNLIRLEDPDSYDELSGFTGNFWNTDPEFISISERNFKYSASSILNENGSPDHTTFTDILERTRNTSAPDIGAYELD